MQFTTTISQTLKIKANELGADVINVLEGLVEFTPVDPQENTWLLKTKTILDTVDDDDGYENVHKAQWSAFLSKINTLNAISPFELVAITGDLR